MLSKYFNFLIDPIPLKVFSESYWERAPLFIERGVGNYFDDILNIADINTFLGRKDLCYPLLRLVKNGEELQKGAYLKNTVIPGIEIVDVDKVFSSYNSGSTIVVQKAQLSIGKVARFCEELAFELNFSLSANLYITPENSKGFNPHYDTHDVFILQISGRKHWDLYNSALTLPLSSQSLSKTESEAYLKAEPDTKIVLSPGDLIYIPRGCVHNAFTTDADSVHITLGAFPPTRTDLLKQILTKAEARIEFRKYLPTALSSQTEKDFFNENFKTVIKAFVEELSITELLGSFENNFLAERFPDTTDRLLSTRSIDNVGLETIVTTKRALSFKLTSQIDILSLRYFDKEIKLPLFMDSSVKSIIDSSPIMVKNIAGLIDDESRLVLVKRLILEGFLVISQNEI